MPQLAIDGQLTFWHPALVGRDRLRMHADAAILAEVKRTNRACRAKSIVFGRRDPPFNWFLCLVCTATNLRDETVPSVVAQWSSSTNPAPKWAQERKRWHWAKHCDEWLTARSYIVPGADAAIDMVLGDALVEAFAKLQVVS